MTGGHRLEHVERLAAADLADDDAVGAHAQGVADQVADGDLSLALHVGRAGFEPDDVRLLELELGGVLDRDDALALRDQAGEGVEEGGLAGAGGAGDDHVQLGRDQTRQQEDHLLVQGADADHLVESEGAGEAADREGGAGQGERRDDHVDALAAGQTGVDHRVRLVHTAVDRGDDALDGLHQLLVRGEAERELLHAAGTLHEDLVGAVDHDLGDGRVFEERFEHAEAEGLVHDAADELGPLGGGEDRALAADDVAEDALQARAALCRRERGHLGEVDLLQQLRAVRGDQAAVLARVVAVVGGVHPGTQAHGPVTSSLRAWRRSG